MTYNIQSDNLIISPLTNDPDIVSVISMCPDYTFSSIKPNRKIDYIFAN